MTIQQFIEKAVEGGWWPNNCDADHHSASKYGLHLTWHRGDGEVELEETLYREIILLDILAWKAVETQMENWNECISFYDKQYTVGWEHYMRGMVNALIAGKTIEEYLATLT